MDKVEVIQEISVALLDANEQAEVDQLLFEEDIAGAEKLIQAVIGAAETAESITAAEAQAYRMQLDATLYLPHKTKPLE